MSRVPSTTLYYLQILRRAYDNCGAESMEKFVLSIFQLNEDVLERVRVVVLTVSIKDLRVLGNLLVMPV